MVNKNKEEQQAATEAQNVPRQENVAPDQGLNFPQQTVKAPNVVNQEQTLADNNAVNKVEQNIDGDRQALQYNENLKTLKRLVSQASPITEKEEEIVKSQDANGNDVEQTITNNVTTGYTYYAIDGKDIDTWISETFGSNITLDKENNKIVYADVNNQGGQ